MSEFDKKAHLTTTTHLEIIADHLEVAGHFHFFRVVLDELSRLVVDVELNRNKELECHHPKVVKTTKNGFDAPG